MKVDTEIFNQLQQILNGQILTREELRNPQTVAAYLDSVKAYEAAIWVRTETVNYLTGLLEGFESSQSLKDIKAKY